MPFNGFEPQCKRCETKTTSIWRRDIANDIICQTCFVNQDTQKSEGNIENGVRSKMNTKSFRTSARFKSIRNRVAPKGKGRRGAYKLKHVPKISKTTGTITTSDFIMYEGQYFQSGDVVSVIDADDHQTYFAQCNSFMTNEYCEKFLSFTWLLPIKKLDSNDSFDPSLFFLGPNDDLIRDIKCVKFVCHAPTDYFKPQQSLYLTLPATQEKGFVSVNLT